MLPGATPGPVTPAHALKSPSTAFAAFSLARYSQSTSRLDGTAEQ
jgi:hypothetical protein